MDIFYCLEKIVPGARYTLTETWQDLSDEEDRIFYENNVIWQDDRQKPSWESLRYAWVEVLARKLCDKVQEYRDEYFYSNYPVQFSDGFGHIQFRDYTDWLIIITNTVGVLQKVLYGSTNDPWEYRDYENVIHSITTGEMLDISNTMMADKTVAWRTNWYHKDALQGIYLSDTMTAEEKIAALEVYDVTTDWPTSSSYDPSASDTAEPSATESPSGE